MELAGERLTLVAMFPDIGRILIEQRQNSSDADQSTDKEDTPGKGDSDSQIKPPVNKVQDSTDRDCKQDGSMTTDQQESDITTQTTTEPKPNVGSCSRGSLRERRFSGDSSSQDGLSRIPRLTPVRMYVSAASSGYTGFSSDSEGQQATIEDIESALQSAELDAAADSPDDLELPMLEDFPDDVDLVYPVVENNYHLSLQQQAPVLFGYDHTQIRFDNQLLPNQHNSNRADHQQFYIPSSPYRPKKR